ncbi:hypothetical protein BC834DRAFT_969460 [Gloeopeniophorella convolvens]|nr:hypothetical protein BC834DRAFT_969460 [Gloeopeniophorella convolvens]
MPDTHLTPQEAQAILSAHIPEPPTDLPVVSLIEPADADPAARANFSSHLVHSIAPPSTHVVILQRSELARGSTPLLVPNTLQAQYKLLTALHKHISSGPPPIALPFPVPVALNAAAPRPYILARLPTPLAPDTPLKPLASIRASLPPETAAALDLRLGAALRVQHDMQSEWCGPPALEPTALYSWQEAFTQLLEEALGSAESSTLVPALDSSLLHACLARAIGAFLFDDVEVPSLVALATSAGSALIAEAAGAEPRLALLLPSLAHLLYGDPLLERAFSPSEALSRALLEGYGDPPPIVFARQRTKRMWYDLYLGLVVLLGAESVSDKGDVAWARELVERSQELLKDAPCY